MRLQKLAEGTRLDDRPAIANNERVRLRNLQSISTSKFRTPRKPGPSCTRRSSEQSIGPQQASRPRRSGSSRLARPRPQSGMANSVLDHGQVYHSRSTAVDRGGLPEGVTEVFH